MSDDPDFSDEHRALKQEIAALFSRYAEIFGPQGGQVLRADLQDAILHAKPAAPRKSVPAAERAEAREASGNDVFALFPEIVTRSPRMREIFEVLLKVAPTNTTVLIQGESGTGKELVARALHHHSMRRDGPFVAENCAALPETLLETELFGHARGAFTGADRSRKGRFMAASGGTLFLDEVGDMSTAMQKKLLRALQEGEIRPVGSNTTIKVDVRFLSASNRDLAQLVQQGRFREDLFYRLSPIRIFLPPLRERGEDVILLARVLVESVARECNLARTPELKPEVLEAFRRYRWPGNVRELRNEMQRVVALSSPDRPIDLSELSAELRKQ